MKFLLKVELDGNRKPVILKRFDNDSGKTLYFVKGYDAHLFTRDEEWVLKNASNILNLSVGENGVLIPIPPKETITKQSCLICSYEVDEAGIYIMAIATLEKSSDKVLVSFYVSNDGAPEIYLYGIETSIAMTQEALDNFLAEYIGNNKWYMLENYYDAISEDY